MDMPQMKDFLLFALVAVLIAAAAYFGVRNAGKTGQEALNRSAFIRVLDAGACNIREGRVRIRRAADPPLDRSGLHFAKAW